MLRLMGRETALTGKVTTEASNMIECVIISKGWVQIGLLDSGHDVGELYNYLKIMFWTICWELAAAGLFIIVMEHKAGSEY